MAWDDYFRFGNVEIINATRTMAYAENMGLSWVKQGGVRPSPVLPIMLGHSTYTTPQGNNAPWYDASIEASREFCGVLPIEISGIEDSSRTTNVFEYTGDGGRTYGIRAGTKEIVMSLVLVAATEAGAEYGQRWLRRALEQRACVPAITPVCGGLDLYYASSRPESRLLVGADAYAGGGGGSISPTLDRPAVQMEWLTEYQHHLRNVTTIRGPLVTGKRTIPGKCGGAVWSVSVTLRADDPFEYATPDPILRNFGAGADPYVPGLTGNWGHNTFAWSDCNPRNTAPIFDPNCKPLAAPPGPPSIPRGCFDLNTNATWQRDYVFIPRSVVPRWDEARPVFTIRTGGADVRMVRLRFFEGGVPTTNCGSVGGFVAQYLPAGSEVVVDTSRNAALGRYSGQSYYRRADSLVANRLGGPVDWWGLSCRQDYYLTLDWVGTRPDVSIDLDFVSRSA